MFYGFRVPKGDKGRQVEKNTGIGHSRTVRSVGLPLNLQMNKNLVNCRGENEKLNLNISVYIQHMHANNPRLTF